MLQLTTLGTRVLLDWAVRTTGTNLSVRLYGNQIDELNLLNPSVIQEASHVGYSPVSLERSGWSVPTIGRRQAAEIRYGAQQQFSFGSQQIVRGAYLTSQSGDLLMIDQFSEAVDQQAGSSLYFGPRLTLGDFGQGSVVIPTEGQLELISWIYRTAGTDQRFRLFSNDIQPDQDTLVGDFVEANFAGYSFRSLHRTGWLPASQHSVQQARIQYGTDLTWTPAGNQTIYGYYVTNQPGTKVLWAHRFAAPRSIQSGVEFSQQVSLTLYR
jgi:hypothetical protein